MSHDAPPAAPAATRSIGRRRRFLLGVGGEGAGDTVLRVLCGSAGLGILAIFAFLVYLLTRGAWPSIQAFGWRFLISSKWSPVDQEFGAAPYLYGTLAAAALGLAISLPVAIGASIALARLLPWRLASFLGLLVELLAAVPSIVFGVWGLAVVVPFVRRLGQGDTFGPSLLSAGIVLACMVLPILTALTRDALRAVPLHQTDAALALGATPWEVTWRVVLPNARRGIVAASLLALGRAVGETMAVIMVIGNQPLFPKSLFDPASTLATVIANGFGDPSGPLHVASLVELGLILLGLSLAINVVARRVLRSKKAVAAR